MEVNKVTLLHKHALIVLVSGLGFALVELLEKQFLLSAVVAAMILSLTIPIIILRERWAGDFPISYLCIGTLLVTVIVESSQGILHELFPLYIVCFVIAGIYFDPKLIIRVGIIMNIVLLVPMLLFWEKVCSGAEIDVLARLFLSMEITIFIVYKTISWGNGFIRDGQKKATKSDELARDVRKRADETVVFMKRQGELLNQINEISKKVTWQSEQVSTGAQSLAIETSAQAGAIEQLNSKAAEITETANRNVEKAKSASDYAEEEVKKMILCSRHMQHMMVSMEDIRGSSNKIEKIMKDIQEIASQTNILALNASVEAARAGVAGKGFAVVAGEVRNLAKKSADAAQRTATLIEGSIKSVELGTSRAKDTADALQVLSNGSEKLMMVVDEISTSSEKQSQSIADMTAAISRISGVVQNISATAQQSAASSEELCKQGRQLKRLAAQGDR